MSDPVLASIIAAAATLVATIMQLRASFAKEATARASQGSSRRKSRAPMALLFVVLIAAASGGFALSHWLTADERVAKVELQQDLKARIADLDHTAAQLAQARSGVRADLEAQTLRELGEAGVISLAAVAPCRSAAPIAPSADSTAALPACTEAEATTVTLCASVPAHATVSDVELYTRPVDSDTPWSAARVQPGQEVDHARFAASTSEIADSESTKLLCQGFSHWASDHARVARMIVHYKF
jgi:hypothetical protein